MDKGVYLLMSGARESMHAQARVANNLANASTTGFRADLHNFRSMASVGDGLQSRVFVQSERPGYNLGEGGLMTTGNPLDIAIKGEGWITVQRPDGSEAYTRAGDLRIDVNGILENGRGFQIMGDNGPISVPPVEKIQIGPDGTITILPVGAPKTAVQILDRIKLVNPVAGNLQKGTDGLFESIYGDIAIADGSVSLVTEALEGSNVNAISELTDMIALSRQFELKVKFMKNFKDLGDKTDALMRVS
ncbi:MAG: flagellar basal-body rod protein FlgF [Gammaproteobacteria bacterium]|nr:MAG: flagellar basal-body rod protein FlgF [Gammaproteobacteria bacterium]